MRTLAILAVLCVPSWGLETLETIDWEWRGSVAQGKALEIRGITGDIRAIPSDGTEIEVLASIDKSEDPGAVEIRAIPNGAGVTVCAVLRGSGNCVKGVAASRVNYEVRVPSGVRLMAQTVNGGIEAQELASDVEAETVNGQVIVSTTGTVQARTVNGSIEASLLKPFWSKAPEFSAVNGKISVNIPQNMRTGVHAETKNGKITTDLPKFHGTSTDQRLEGSIGSAPPGGANPMIIRTLNGSIDLRQRY